MTRTDEDIEGSFDNDVLDRRFGPPISCIGQPGVDSFYGRGGEDTIVAARRGQGLLSIQCGTKGHPEGIAIIDSIDPEPEYCKTVTRGTPLAGLHKVAMIRHWRWRAG